jgi:hypothetical protein
MPRAAKKTSKPCTGPACAKPAGKTASGRKSKSKTGDPACSAAMSAWVTTRKSGATPAGVQAILGKCRSMARQRRMGQMHAAAGNTAKAQHIEHRLSKGVNGPVTQAERTARAKELLATRAAKQSSKPAVKQATAESIMSRSTSSVVESAKVKRVADVAADMSEAIPSGRVMIRDLRARFPGMGKAEFDKTLLAAHASKRHGVSLMKADDPRLAKEHAADAVKTPSGEPRHIVYAGGRYRTPDKPRAVKKR